MILHRLNGRIFLLASLVTTVRETLRYRGKIGQWSWVLHRLTGLGVVFFLVIHVIDTSWAVFYPDLYEKAMASYQTPLFTIGEYILVFAVVYHAFNGLRIAVFDFKPEWWPYQERAAWGVLGATALLLIPVFIGMTVHVIDHYASDPFVLPLGEVIIEQMPFLAGMVIAAIAAFGLSWLYSVFFENEEPVTASGGGSALERFWWSFMRISGILIIPLVFGHLAMMHVLQGVFDITTAGYVTVGTTDVNVSGTATEFVANRWNYLVGGVAIWKLYDIALLSLTAVHGFNGLRYVLTDYTMHSPVLRRAATYLCIIGALVLLIVGSSALLGTIEPEAIEMAQESLALMRGGE